MMKTEQSDQQNPKNRRNKGIRDFARYSGLVFQMAGIILVTTWGGTKLDQLSGTNKPVFTIILSLLGVFGAIYTAIRDFIK